MEQYTLGEVLTELALPSNHIDIWTLHDANNELIARATIINLVIMLGTRWFDYPVNETNSKNHYIRLAVQVFQEGTKTNLEKAIDNLVEQSSSEAITLATPIKKE